MAHTETVNVWVPVFDYGLCARKFGFAVVGQPDRRRASVRRQVESLAKNAAKTIVSQHGMRVLEIADCGPLGYDSENYLGVRVRVNVEVPEDVVACAESLKRLPKETLCERVRMLYEAGDKNHARRWDINAILIGDFFVDGYCLSWSAIYRQVCIQIRELGSAYISHSEFLSLTGGKGECAQCTRASFLHQLKALFRRH